MNAKNRGVSSIVCSSLEEALFDMNSLPAVGIFDVLEHIKDDLEFLIKIYDRLIPGGKLYVTVPAYSFLWSSEDDDAGHFRRYSIKSLSRKLKSAGFQIEFATYLFWFLPVPIFFYRKLPSMFGKNVGDNPERIIELHNLKNKAYKTILETFLSFELNKIAKGKKILFGGSCLAVARAI